MVVKRGLVEFGAGGGKARICWILRDRWKNFRGLFRSLEFALNDFILRNEP